jgi:hypothetical protein
LSGNAAAGATAFELDRFELVEGERYEVEGRWSGIRGRIFIRPELTVTDGKQSRRLLADLADKPWQAGDGGHWSAAFPCAGAAGQASDGVDVELTVAPDITVAVKRGRSRRARTANPRAEARAKTEARAEARAKTEARPEARPKTEARAKPRGLGVQLAAAQSELEQLRTEHARLSGRLDAAARRVEEARAERDHASQSREQMVAERREAIRERDEARAERDQAIREAAIDHEVAMSSRDEALAELEQTRGELARMREALAAMATERDSAVRAGVELQRELHAAHAERAHLLEDREQLAGRPDALHDGVKPLPAAAADFSWGASGGMRSRRGQWLGRAVALLALAAAVVTVLLVLMPGTL